MSQSEWRGAGRARGSDQAAGMPRYGDLPAVVAPSAVTSRRTSVVQRCSERTIVIAADAERTRLIGERGAQIDVPGAVPVGRLPAAGHDVRAHLVAVAADRRPAMHTARPTPRCPCAATGARRRARGCAPPCRATRSAAARRPARGCAMNTGTQSATVTASAARSTVVTQPSRPRSQPAQPTAGATHHRSPCTWCPVTTAETRRRERREAPPARHHLAHRLLAPEPRPNRCPARCPRPVIARDQPRTPAASPPARARRLRPRPALRATARLPSVGQLRPARSRRRARSAARRSARSRARSGRRC